MALRRSVEDVRVLEFPVPHIVESNRAPLADASGRGEGDFRRALANAIFAREEALPWTVTIVEQGLFDRDPEVRACFAGAVTAVRPVLAGVRERLYATPASWESSRSALSFLDSVLQAKAEGRPLR